MPADYVVEMSDNDNDNDITNDFTSYTRYEIFFVLKYKLYIFYDKNTFLLWQKHIYDETETSVIDRELERTR